MESIDATQSSMAGKVQALQKLESKDIIIAADSYEIKNLIEHKDRGAKVIKRKYIGK